MPALTADKLRSVFPRGFGAHDHDAPRKRTEREILTAEHDAWLDLGEHLREIGAPLNDHDKLTELIRSWGDARADLAVYRSRS